MAAIVGVAFEMAERMLRREVVDTEAAAADFATALFMGGIRTLPRLRGLGSGEGYRRMKALVCRELSDDFGRLAFEDVTLPPPGAR